MLKLNYYIKSNGKWIQKTQLKGIKSQQVKNKTAFLWLYNTKGEKVGKIKIQEIANINSIRV